MTKEHIVCKVSDDGFKGASVNPGHKSKGSIVFLRTLTSYLIMQNYRNNFVLSDNNEKGEESNHVCENVNRITSIQE